MQIFKQRQTGTFLGITKILVAQVSPYVNWLSLALVGIMSFYTTISPVLSSWGILFSFRGFVIVLGAILASILTIEWVFMMRSYYAAGNIQAWECENPQRELMEKMEKDIKKARKEIKELKEMLKRG